MQTVQVYKDDTNIFGFQICRILFFFEYNNDLYYSNFRIIIINKHLLACDMPKGLKSTSSQIVISGQVSELGPNTFTPVEVDLQLNVLDREVFVVTAVDLDLGAPEILSDGTDVSTRGCVSSTNRDTMGTIADTNVLAAIKHEAQGHSGGNYILVSSHSMDTPPANLDYIGIIATNNFFVFVEGIDMQNATSLQYRVFGYRAVADAAAYAALTQSELLSAN